MEEKIRLLKEQYEERLRQKEELQRQAELTELKLDRAAKLVSGLAGERERWMETAEVPTHCTCVCMYVCMYKCLLGMYCVCIICVHSVVSRSFLKGTEPFLRPKVSFIMTQNTPFTPLPIINVHQCGFAFE